jgi:methionyl-tRNA synthetase
MTARPCCRPAPAVAELYEEREYGKALREIMALADKVNEYVDCHKPWELAKHAEACSAARLRAPASRPSAC